MLTLVGRLALVAVLMLAMPAYASMEEGAGVDEQVRARLEGVRSAALEPEVMPDVVRAGTTRLRVQTDIELEAPVTVEIQPPDGIRVGPVKLETSSANGSVLTVEVTVAPTAMPGERQITAVQSSAAVSTSQTTRPGVDEEMKRAIEALIKSRGLEAVDRIEIGSLHINSHDLAITNVTPRGRTVTVHVNDDLGDFQPPPPEFLVSEMRCGSVILLGAVTDTKVSERRGSSVVIQGNINIEPGEGPCDLQVRARDAAGNISEWYFVKLPKLPATDRVGTDRVGTDRVGTDGFVLSPEIGRLVAGTYELDKVPASGLLELTVEYANGALRLSRGAGSNLLVPQSTNQTVGSDGTTSDQYRFTVDNSPAVTVAFTITKGRLDYLSYFEDFPGAVFSARGYRNPR